MTQVEIHAPDGSLHETQLTIATLNTQSIKNKEQLVLRELNHKNIDICIVTESWIKDSDEVWLKGSDLNKGPYRCYTTNREYAVGGGILLICKSSLDVKVLDKANNHTYEHATWQITHKKKHHSYRDIPPPPPPLKDRIMNGMFIDEFTEHLVTLLTNKQNNIITGDFNMQLDNLHDPDATIFKDTIIAFGLRQHINVATHNKGNTLNLLLSEDQANLIGKVEPGALISDHYLLSAALNIKKPHLQKDKVTIRKISVITDEMLCQEFDDTNLPEGEELDILIDNLNNELNRIMATLAPPKEVTLLTHKRQPWYDDQVKSQHEVIRNRERVWQKYKLESNWETYTKE